MKCIAIAAAVAAATLPEAAAFSSPAALPLRGSQLSSAKAHCVHRPAAAVTMSAERSQHKSFLGKIGQAAKGAAFAAVLGMGVIVPRKAMADGEFGMSADGLALMEEPVLVQPSVARQSSGFDVVRAGVAAGAGAATFGGLMAVSIKKHKSELNSHAEHFEEELKRLENFKQEFLDGVPSDNSLMASLNKAMRPAAKEVEEDEFEKNVRLFLEEEQAKDDKKKGVPPANAKTGGATLLERPGDVSGDKADEWMNDVVFEDKPAEIDDEQLKRLQRMFGTGDSKESK